MGTMEPHEKDLLNKTHGMVKSLYQMIVGTGDYKDASIITQLREVKEEVQSLRDDKIRRDATLKAVGFLSGALGTFFGGMIMYFIKKYGG